MSGKPPRYIDVFEAVSLARGRGVKWGINTVVEHQSSGRYGKFKKVIVDGCAYFHREGFIEAVENRLLEG
jgi:hypothetical protein